MFVLGFVALSLRGESQLSPCEHLVITHTGYYGQNPALHPANASEVWLKMTLAIADSHYYGLQTTSRGSVRYNESS